ncbi:MAG: NAD+ synthase [Desulfobacterales bacterium]|nr:NAD+ synthase [Desulfobacterales bacterium]
MKIAIVQLNTVIGYYKYNTNKIIEYAEKAKEMDCDLVVFSEMAISGYPPRDLLEKRDFVDANLAALEKIVKNIKGIGVICGYVDKNISEIGNPLYNAAVLFENGKIIHKDYKRLLPTYDIFDESRYFEPGTDCSTFEYKGHKIGLTICEDAWNDKEIFKKRIYHVDPVAKMAEEGADLIINISASPFYDGKRAFKTNMLHAISKKYNVSFVYSNQVGGNDSILFDGSSMAFNASGKVAAEASDFEEDIICFDTKNGTGDIKSIPRTDADAIYRALVMGTRDYMTKCGFSKAVIGLSGGIDSALTACVAADALGSKNVFTVFMPSRYTSQNNFEDTRQLAENLGVRYHTIPIDKMFKEYLPYISPGFDEKNPGVTEQNIQARIRGTIVMAISNRDGSMVLSTGNKSESAVGYCTLYGDMNGGLAVISDVPKIRVYELSRFINETEEIIPQRIIDKAPSAELKPDQTDQDDLPSYDVLDAILKGYIEDLKSVDELVDMGYEKSVVMDIIKRVHRNEYKRQQAAPGLKVTSKAFGYGRRYPLAQKYMPE